MSIALLTLFWGSLLGLFYAYLGYPTLIGVIARMHARMQQPVVSVSDDITDSTLPEITVLIAAYNAEQHLAERIENILNSDYPIERLNILVASDGSTDGTVRVVDDTNDPRVTAIKFSERRGKAATLVNAVKFIASPVIVFTDATTQFDCDSLRRLAHHFQDPQVGLVAGKVSIIDEQGAPSESVYWRIEMMVRQWEAQLGITLGASGAIYAIRRSKFVAPSGPVINDDLVLPMLVQLKHQCRLVFDTSARAFASSSGAMAADFSRRCRIGKGAFQCLPALRDLLRWRNRWQAAAFASHKLLRWICPFLMVAAFASNVALVSERGYQVMLLLQLLAYGTAAYGSVASQRGITSRIARIATSFVVMNVALAVGIFRWMLNPETVTWVPTQRPNWNHMPTPLTTLRTTQHATQKEAA